MEKHVNEILRSKQRGIHWNNIFRLKMRGIHISSANWRIKSIILLLIITTWAAEPVFSQNQEQLFQQALMKEEGEGALQEAIDIYTKIVENSSAERLLRANAQLQIGLCYEKLGKKQATEAYNRVIKQFADQQQTAEIAKARIQSLNSQITSVDKNAAKP